MTKTFDGPRVGDQLVDGSKITDILNNPENRPDITAVCRIKTLSGETQFIVFRKENGEIATDVTRITDKIDSIPVTLHSQSKFPHGRRVVLTLRDE